MSHLLICSLPSNDLYRTLCDNRIAVSRFDSPAAALAAAAPNDALAILADHYPTETAAVDAAFFAAAAQKNLRLYVEFPAFVPGVTIGDTVEVHNERVVVTSDTFGPSLKPLRILQIHDCHYQSIAGQSSLLAIARVAGFESAVYGLPENASPILFELPGQSALIATTKLSHFITARYSPSEAWGTVWTTILNWLLPHSAAQSLHWHPVLTATWTSTEKLPASAALDAVQRGTEWFFNAGMLKGADGEADPNHSGNFGVMEGLRSKILLNGNQAVASGLRNDCCSEAAMALAIRDWHSGDPRAASAAANLQDYIFGPDGFIMDPSDDPASPTYGLMSWSHSAREIYFGDDNARAILGSIATAAALNDDRWDEHFVRVILGNFRTSGQSACQGHNLWEPLLFKFGWEHFWNADEPRLSPHFESWLFACYLWLYGRTKFAPLLERTRRGIGKMMAAYPNGWRWTNGLQQERARLILPLAWLIRVDDTPEHRGWLKTITDDLLRSQDACGAIREELGDPSKGTYGPPKTNEAYGTNEAPLIHNNGEPVCDLLYTSNFAFVGLNEAAAATNDPKLVAAADRLADFLIRIQAKSPSIPQTDGAWFRSFDFNRWEHWGANADGGWGVWCVESGWTQGWIASTLALRARNTNFWDFTSKSCAAKVMDRIRPIFIPDRVLANSSTPHTNGKSNGQSAQRVRVHFEDYWTCYVGKDLETTIDLGSPRVMNEIGADFFSAQSRNLKLPERIEFSVSDDGKEFQPAGAADTSPDHQTEGHMSVQTLTVPTATLTARYIRMRALRSAATTVVNNNSPNLQIPDNGNRKQWLFVDEIVVK